MKQLHVYLAFAGTCAEALEFYKTCLNGEIVSKQTFGETPMGAKPGEENRIMHSEFRAEGIYFMASDGNDEHPVRVGNNVSLSINLDDEAEQTEIFTRLSAGGHVAMELQDTFWGARFGMLTDKFGISWLLNCEKKQS